MKAGLLAMALALASCARSAADATARLPLVPEADRSLGEILIDADRVVAGRLVAVERAEQYEPLGQLTFPLIRGAWTGVPQAYDAKIRVDSTLLGGESRMLWITFFAPKGARILAPDTTAIWVLHRRTLWRLARCSEIQSMTSTACPYDIGLALDSDADVRPLADWPRLQALARTLRLRVDRTAP